MKEKITSTMHHNCFIWIKRGNKIHQDSTHHSYNVMLMRMNNVLKLCSNFPDCLIFK